MPQFHVYLISSLPMLHFGMKPPFSFEKFLKMCEGLVSDEDAAVIASVASRASSSRFTGLLAKTVLGKWYNFDTSLRNELVKIRAARKHIDPLKYLRHDGFTESSISHAALAAARNPSIIESEKMLDRQRWHFLDELSIGHYFDIDFLIIYALKLLILGRWGRINSTDPVKEVRQLC